MGGGEASGGKRKKSVVSRDAPVAGIPGFAGDLPFTTVLLRDFYNKNTNLCHVLLCYVLFMIGKIPLTIEEAVVRGFSGRQRELCLQVSRDIRVLRILPLRFKSA